MRFGVAKWDIIGMLEVALVAVGQVISGFLVCLFAVLVQMHVSFVIAVVV